MLVRGSFAAVEEYFRRSSRGTLRECDVLVADDDHGQCYRFTVYYTVNGADENRAVAYATGKQVCGEYLVLATHVRGSGTRYSNLRTVYLADEALDT